MCSSFSSLPAGHRAARVIRSLLPLLALTACGLGVTPQAHAVLDRSPSNAPDGISDVWAFIHDYNSASNAADADSDGDGVSNRDEAGAGTHPRDPASRPFVSLEVAAPGAAQVRFPTQRGKRYQIQRSSTLSRGSWTTFATHQGTGAALSADASLNGSSASFFRALIDDVDTDADGLADWEEIAVGYDPASAYTRREPGTDLERLAERLGQSDQVSISAMAAESSEAWPRSMTVAIRRRQGFRPLSLTVGLAGTATRGVDYASPFSAGATLVTFAPNEREKYYTFTPLADALDGESAETIVVTLNPVGASLIGSASVTLSIANSTAASAPTIPEASRFLQQATFGADEASLAAVMNRGFANWISDESALPNPGRISPWVHRQNKTTPGNSDYRAQTPAYPNPSLIEACEKQVGIWHAIMGRRDPQAPAAESGVPSALRQRAAYALSQVLVVSDKQADLHYHTEGMADYWDTLLVHAFGNYRDLLRSVTLHPCMGVYLSHLKNRKADPALSRYPDENYAREILQLFTVGLWQLNPDGTRRLDASGNPITTYGNAEVTAFARVFTGLSWARNVERNDSTGGVTVSPASSFFITGWGDYLAPMKLFDSEHDFAAKQLLAYPGAANSGLLAARVDNPLTESEGLVELDAALDNLFNHPNTAPFLARRFIQQLVTSNPSPAYVGRVAEAFATGRHAGLGTGRRGDLLATWRAVLLDPEARDYSTLEDPARGRLQEPFVRAAQMLRHFRANTPAGGFPFYFTSLSRVILQEPLSSPSVFNFYLPDHRPAGEMARAGFFGPELQLVNTATAISLPNQLRWWSFDLNGTGWGTDNTLSLDLAPEKAVAHDADALVRRLDARLAAGRLSPETFSSIRDCIERYNWGSMDDAMRAERTRIAYYLVAMSADGAVLR